MGKAKQGPRIEQYFLRSSSNQSSEVQRLEFYQSSQDISPPEEPNSGTVMETEVCVEPIPPGRPATERKTIGSRPRVKWPGALQKKEWESINADLTIAMEGMRGTFEKKLNSMGDLIYDYGVERYGVEKREKAPPLTNRSRRQEEIERLVRERRQLKKRWKKASDREKEGINILQDDIKHRLASLRRAENLRKLRKGKERTRSRFFKDPFKFLKTLFAKEKGGRLKTSKQELDEYLEKMYADEKRHERTTIPLDIPPIEPPAHPMDTRPPLWREVEHAVKRARSSSAPGPNGVPYRLYKNAPGVLRFLWRLMRLAWEQGIIPKAWRRAGGVLIPKEKDSTDINQFRPISLLNVEGKIFFSVIAQRMTSYLERNNLVDTTIQKAGIPGFSGCLEHTSMIWHQIQTAKKEKSDLHVVFLDLANAFGSVPHNFLWSSFDFFRIPGTITHLVQEYFQDLQLCFTMPDFTTTWHHMEIGIMAGCTISPLAFTMAMEVIIRASKWVVGGKRLKSGVRLPPIRAYMDDMTTVTTTTSCTRRLLGKLQENITGARMKIKPSKSRSISILKGKLTEQRFFIGQEPIPTVSEKPIKSLGRWYDSKLRDTDQALLLRQEIIEGLQSIDRTLLPGKLKIWCLQFGLLPRLMWPLTMYNIALTNVEKMERTISSYVRKWLGVPRCLSGVGLYGQGLLELPLSSLTEEFKCAKVRLEMTLAESKDNAIRAAAPTPITGRKWSAKLATQQAKSALHHGDIVGQVQHGKGGFGLGEKRPSWNRASSIERRKLVVNEIHRQEESVRYAKAVSQAKQGQWTRWEGVEKRKINWKDIWEMETSRMSFLIRATYDVLPTPKNLNQWFGEDPLCPLCAVPATLRHILTGCKVSLSQGRYTWRHNQVLRCLAAALESKRTAINALQSKTTKPALTIAFVHEGEKPRKIPPRTRLGQLEAARDWQMLVDVDQRLTVPSEIAITSLRPDLVMWSLALRKVYFVELTVPWEDSIHEAFERKKLRYTELAAEAVQRGWKADICPVEVGCRGFVATSTLKLLKDLGIVGQALRQTIREIVRVAEYSSRWIWLRRKDLNWSYKQ